jgi:hypothetical protein
VSRQSLHSWLAKHEAGGLEGLVDRSHRPLSSPHQMLAAVLEAPAEASVVGSAADRGRGQQGWSRPRGDRVLGVSLFAAGGADRAGWAAAAQREWKRWERGRPNELWQMDTVGGFLIADGSHAKALTGQEDHSRFCVSARLMPRERTRPVCDGLTAAISAYGAPEQLLGARLTQNRGTPHHSTAGLGVA